MVGPGCKRTLEGLGSTKNKFYHKNWVYSSSLTLSSALFRGIRDLVPVPSKSRSALEETPGCLGGRLRGHKGHGTSQLVVAYIVMAYAVMAYAIMAYIVMAYAVMAYIVMAYVVMAYAVMAYIVMALTRRTRLVGAPLRRCGRSTNSSLFCRCHNYIGHNYIGHHYIGHHYIGHNCICHKCIGHNCICHNYIVRCQSRPVLP